MTFGPDVDEVKQSFCWTFTQKGHCYKGDACPWVHSTDEVQAASDPSDAICRAWVMYGSCPREESCRWAHPVTQVPVWVPIEMVQPTTHMQQTGEMMRPVLLPQWVANGGIVPEFPSFGFGGPEFAFAAPQDLVACDVGHFNVALEENADSKDYSNGSWDQFEANRTKFGVETTFLEDLSQYSTQLDVSKVPAQVVRKAERIAREIEADRRVHHDNGAIPLSVDNDGDYQEDMAADGSGDEEMRFSAVRRHGRSDGGLEKGNRHTDAPASLVAELRSQVNIAESALVVKLRQRLAASRIQATDESDQLFRCGFCDRILGDVAEVVAHWTASLQRCKDADFRSPCQVATRHLRGVAESQAFEEFVAEHGIDKDTGSLTASSKQVWRALRDAIAERRRISEATEPDGIATTVAEAIDALRSLSLEGGEPGIVVARHALLEAIAAAIGSYLFDPEQRDLCPSMMITG